MAKRKKKVAPIKISKTPNPREVKNIIVDTSADTEPILDLNTQDKTTEGLFNSIAPQGSTRNDLTITFRYNFDKITRLKEIALQETKDNGAIKKKTKSKKPVKIVQYTDLMRRAIDEKYEKYFKE